MALAVVLLPRRLKVRLDRIAVRLHGLKGCGRIGTGFLGLGEASTEGLVFPREVADLVGARLFAVAQVAGALPLDLERRLQLLDPAR